MTTMRRFLLSSSLSRLIVRERGGARQTEGYFPERNGRLSSVLLSETKGLLILRRREMNEVVEEYTEIPQSQAAALLDVAAGEIDSVRTVLTVGTNNIIVDRIIQPIPLTTITIAFDTSSAANGFQIPSWFGPEVTTDDRFDPFKIATEGLNVPTEVEPTNSALMGLLDQLENRALGSLYG